MYSREPATVGGGDGSAGGEQQQQKQAEAWAAADQEAFDLLLQAEAAVGLGRIVVALYYRSSTLYNIH
jgi:hypothetical protein